MNVNYLKQFIFCRQPLLLVRSIWDGDEKAGRGLWLLSQHTNTTMSSNPRCNKKRIFLCDDCKILHSTFQLYSFSLCHLIATRVVHHKSSRLQAVILNCDSAVPLWLVCRCFMTQLKLGSDFDGSLKRTSSVVVLRF